MASELDDLNFEIKGDISRTLDSLDDLGAILNSRFDDVDRLNTAFRSVSAVQMPQVARFEGVASETGSLLKLTAAASGLVVLSRVSSTMRGVSQSVATVGRQATITAGHMDRFRLGLSAVPVNPNLNVAKHGLDALGTSASKVIDTVRGVADAILSDLPGAVSAGASAVGGMNKALDSASATASKHVDALHTMQGSLSLLKTVFPFAASAIDAARGPLDAITAKADQVANSLDEMNSKVATTAADVRGAAFLMGDGFKYLGGTADMLARSQYYALLPYRLLVREMEGGRRLIHVAKHAWAILSAPIHSVTMAVARSRAEWKDLNARLPQVAGGLNLGARAMRLFGQSTYLASTATRAVVTPLAAVAKVSVAAARGVWSIISPAKSAATSLLKLTGVQNTFIGRALGMKKAGNDAASGLAAMDRQSARAGNGMSYVGSKAGMLKTAAAGLVAGFVALGTSSAIATEKNNAVFGTMLHDMGQGAAVVKSLQGTQAAKFFDNQELLDSGRLLFKAGVSARDLAGKTESFAKIASATSTELADLTRIYQQGANAGAFGQDKINQYAERGIAIYDGLKAATGLSGAELQKMVSDGKIGVAEMDAALAHLTEGHGIYADSLTNLAGTTAGKMATVKNNVTQALGGIMEVALQILAPFGTALVMMSESVKSGFDSFRGPILYAASAGAWFFGNIVDLSKFAFNALALMSVSFFNDLIYFFTDKIPAYLSWFADNWKEVFYDIFNGTMTIFSNLGKNIATAMAAIWEFIASGGSSTLEFAFVPLMDGFKKTMKDLPNIPERGLTQLEQQLTDRTEQLGGDLADNFDKMLADASLKVSEAVPEIADTTNAATVVPKDQTTKAGAAANRQAAENKAALVRSSEGQSVVAQFIRGMAGSDKEQRARKAAEDTAKATKQIAAEMRRGKPLQQRAWA